MTEPLIPKGAHAADRNVGNIEYERESPPGVPRWVKLLGIAVVLVGLLFAAMHLAGNGGGPGAHFAEHGLSMP